MRHINPYSIYTFSWIVVVTLYSFKWSSLYPNLEISLLSFFVITGFVSWLISRKMEKGKSLRITKLSSPNRFKKLFKWYLTVNYGLLMLEFWYNGGIPLFLFSAQEYISETDYMKFGIPVVRVFVINSFCVISCFSAYCIASSKRNNAVFWKSSLFLALLSPILCVQRGIFLNQIFCCAIIYLIFHKISFKKVFSFFVVSLIIMYGFGVVGNIRSAHGDDSYMNELWEANKNFEKTGIPAPFFWGYIYATSPLANLQNAITKKTVNISDFNFYGFIVQNILPQIISKHIEVKDEGYKYYIYPNLVVCTTFFHSYLNLGWGGIVVMYIYIILFVSFFLSLVRIKSPFRIPYIVCLCQIVFFSIFDNMVHYMGMLPQIALYLLLSWKVKKIRALKSV